MEEGLNRDLTPVGDAPGNAGLAPASDDRENTGFAPVSDIRARFGTGEHKASEYSPLALAFIGDAVFDLFVRTYLVEQGNTQVHKLHKRKSEIVKAEAQKNMYFAVRDVLTEEEEAVYKRGRNAKSYSTAKNASVGDYRVATGLEALFGWLYLTEKYDRMLELLKAGFDALNIVPVKRTDAGE